MSMTRRIVGSPRSRSGSPPSRPGWRWGVRRGGRSSGSGSPSTLANRLPVTRRLLEAGRISGYQALIAAGESQRLTEDECSVFEHRVYPRGESQTPARFRRACRLVAAALHPEHLEAAHARGEEADGRHEVGRGRRDGVPAPAGSGSGDPRDLGVGEHRSPRASPRREESGEDRVPIGERRIAVFTRWARTGDSHLRGLGITRDGADAFDPTQDDRSPADVTALLEDQLSDGTTSTTVSEPASEEQLAAAAATASVEGEPVEGSKPANLNPLGLPTGTGGEDPARGDHRPRRRPRRQRRTSDPRGLRTDPRLHRPRARR